MNETLKERMHKVLFEKVSKDIPRGAYGISAILANYSDELISFIESERNDAEIALARKVLAVSGGIRKQKGLTQAKRLAVISQEMNKIIPSIFGDSND